MAAAVFFAISEPDSSLWGPCFFVLLAGNTTIFTWRLHVNGLLRLSPKDLLIGAKRNPASLLSTLSFLLALIALIACSLR